ncbi:Acyltransferase [Sarracenia purpurea var. burkii]
MPLSSSLLFSVRRKEPELVMPAKPVPREIKELSDIDDQQGLRFQFPMIMYYRENPRMGGKNPARHIRDALAKALVYFYPYAGRLIEGVNKKLMVDCNSEGVLFVEAEANVRLEELGNTILPVCPYWEELLCDVPGSRGIVDCPLMLIQVTRLMCGGFTFAIRLNHTMSDGFGEVMFLNAIGEMAQGASVPSLLPVWQRELLKARSPPHITRIHHEYDESSEEDNNYRTQMIAEEDEDTICKSFFFGPEEIRAIRKHLPPPNIQSCSTFMIIAACIWKCRTIALRVDPEELIRLTFSMNLRNIRGLNLPSGYYGNAIATPGVVTKVKTLCDNELGYVVGLLKEAKSRVDEEYVRSMTDLMVIKGRPSVFAWKWRGYVVSDQSRLGFGEVDFGWGSPVYGGTVGVSGSMYPTTYITRIRNEKGEEVLVVPIELPTTAMKRFQDELKKFAQGPVEDLCDRPVMITF